MRELVELGLIVAAIALGYFVGYRDGKDAAEEERREEVAYEP